MLAAPHCAPAAQPRLLQLPRFLLTPLQRVAQTAARADVHLARLEALLPGAAAVAALAGGFLLSTGQLAAAQEALRAARAADPAAATGAPAAEALAELWLGAGNAAELALLARDMASSSLQSSSSSSSSSSGGFGAYGPEAAYVAAHHFAALDELGQARKVHTRSFELYGAYLDNFICLYGDFVFCVYSLFCDFW